MALSTYTPAENLFSTYDANGYWNDARKEAQSEILEISRKSFLATDDQTLLRRFEAKYKKEPIKLILEGTRQNSDESVNAPIQDPFAASRQSTGYVPRPLVKYYIPFEGDKILFEFRPNPFSLSPPQGFVSGRNLCVPILAFTGNIPDTVPEFEKQKAQITSSVESLNKQFADLGTTFSSSVLEMIRAQRKVLEKQQKESESLPYPERK